MKSSRTLAVCTVFFFCGLVLVASAQTRTLRIAIYNIEDDINGATTPLPGLIAASGGSVTNGGVLEGIGEQVLGSDGAQPVDIVTLEETTSNPITVAPITNALNAYYNAPGMYSMSLFQATESGGDVADGNGPSAVVYNTTTVQLLASVPVDPPGGTSKLGSSSGEYREVMRYEFAPAGVTPTADNEFYIYVSHYKASTGTQNETYRAEEAQIIRNNSATLTNTARVIYVGDYNVSSSTEAGYQTIIGAGVNQGIDPLNLSGATGINFGNSSLLSEKTESATDLRYRDDLQIMTTNIYYGQAGGLALVPGTYHVFGNNGTTAYEGSVGAGGNTSLTNLVSSASYPYNFISASTLRSYLTTASDHLPVVADYTIPITTLPVAGFIAGPTNGIVPLSVTFTNLSTGATNYAWTFGDGNTSTLTNAANTYNTPGTYTVALTAIGAGGTNISTLVNYITVLNPPTPAGLQLAGFFLSATNGFQFAITNTDGTPFTTAQQSHIAIYGTTNLGLAFSNWTVLTNSILLTNGLFQINDTNGVLVPQQYYRAVYTP